MFAPPPHPDLLALLAAIKADPADDTPKLVLADWLQEQPGEADRARGEWLRLRVGLDRLAEHDPRRPEVEGRLAHLWDGYRDGWVSPLVAAGFGFGGDDAFAAGLLCPVVAGRTAVSKRVAAVVGTEAWAWVGGLRFHQLTAGQLRRLLHGPLFGGLARLHLHGVNVLPWGIEELAASPAAAGLRDLKLCYFRLGDTAAAALAGSPHTRDPREQSAAGFHLGGLRTLTLTGCDVGGDAGFRELVTSPALAALRALAVKGAGLTAHSARAFADSGGPRLAALDLADNPRIGSDGVRLLVSAPAAGALTRLGLEATGPRDDGAEAVARQPHLRRLTHLTLSRGLIGDRGAAALEAAQSLAGLEVLDLRTNQISDTGAIALAGSPHLGNLHDLDLRGNQIGPRAAAALYERFGERVTLG